MKFIIIIAMIYPVGVRAQDYSAAEQAALEARIEQLERDQRNAESKANHLDTMQQIKGYRDPLDAGVW